jgi:pimeloyl-ACP methyl ester carboxylesterase
MDFTPTIDDAALADLRCRLDLARWPEPETHPDQGLPLDWLRDLVDHWRHRYDWNRLRARLGSVPQVLLPADGLDHHALHVRSSHPEATPLLLAHGWPSTCFEFLDAVRLLTEPEDGGQAFHVVCPSLPGYAFSGKPREPGWGAARIADAWVTLMSGLGYDAFLAHGGDWGATVTTELALRHPGRLTGLHLTMPLVAPTADEIASASPEEAAGLARDRDYRRRGFGYAQIQLTRPQTLGYALDDSPVGLCAWIVEKLRDWSGRDATGRPLLSDDAMLDVVSVYWLTRTATSSARLYFESLRMDLATPVTVPTGCSIFADEIIRPPRAAVARRYPNLRSWRTVDRGGHFPAAEVPGRFADEIKAFAKTLSDA